LARSGEARGLWERNLPTPLLRVRWAESFHEASCVILRVRSQLFGWRSLAVFVGSSTTGLRGFQPCKAGDIACVFCRKVPVPAGLRFVLITAFRHPRHPCCHGRNDVHPTVLELVPHRFGQALLVCVANELSSQLVPVRTSTPLAGHCVVSNGLYPLFNL
jgi:hypothetical protein